MGKPGIEPILLHIYTAKDPTIIVNGRVELIQLFVITLPIRHATFTSSSYSPEPPQCYRHLQPPPF